MRAPADMGQRSTADESEQLATLRARFAILVHELHAVGEGGQVHYEVRQSDQTRSCSTLHDLQGFLAVLEGRS